MQRTNLQLARFEKAAQGYDRAGAVIYLDQQLVALFKSKVKVKWK